MSLQKVDLHMYVCIYVAFLGLLQIDRVCGTKVYILPAKKTLYAEAGTNVSIVCVVEELDGKSVQWTHNGRQIAIVAPENTIVYADPNDQKKYLLTGADKSGGNFTFSLANFNSLDSGRVVCGVSDVLPAEIQLELFDEPQDISIAIHSQHRLLWSGGAIPKFQHLVQDTVNMTCTVYNSIPKGIIRWLINGTEAGKINTTEKYETKDEKHTVSSNIVLTPNNLNVLQDVEGKLEDVIGVIELWSIQPLLDNNATSSIIENGTDLEITTFEESTLQVSCLSLVGEQEYRKDILIDLTAKLISGTSPVYKSGTSPVKLRNEGLLCLYIGCILSLVIERLM